MIIHNEISSPADAQATIENIERLGVKSHGEVLVFPVGFSAFLVNYLTGAWLKAKNILSHEHFKSDFPKGDFPE